MEIVFADKCQLLCVNISNLFYNDKKKAFNYRYISVTLR